MAQVPGWIVTAKASAKSVLVDAPLAVPAPSEKQKGLIKWLASIPADGLAVKNGHIKPLTERIANLHKSIKKWIRLYDKATDAVDKNGALFAVKGIRRLLWLHLEAVKLQGK